MHAKRAIGSFVTAANAQAAAAVLSWVAVNVILTLSNKYLMALSPLRLPVTVTLLHMAASAMMCNLLVGLEYFEAESITSVTQLGGVAMLGAAVALSVSTGVACLKYVPVSLDMAVGSTTPAWVALLVFISLRRVETAQVYTALVVSVAGCLMALGADPSFHALGFLLSFLSMFGRAVKALMQQKLMSTGAVKLSPINLLSFQATTACVLLLPLAILEGPGELVGVLQKQLQERNFLWLAFFGCNIFLAFLTNLTQFWMTQATSAITSQLVGNAKNVVLSALSVIIFQNPVTMASLVGYGMTFAAVGYYAHLKNLPEHATRQLH